MAQTLVRTDRLIIRELSPGDIDEHHALLSDDEVMHYLPDIQSFSRKQSERDLRETVEEIGKPDRKHYFYAIVRAWDSAFVGEAGFTVDAFTPAGKLVSAGYFINKEFWGLGYTAEAMRAVMAHAFEKVDVYRVATGCCTENAASERVMQKCGMTREGEHKECFWHCGKMKDRVEYRMLKSEWKSIGLQVLWG